MPDEKVAELENTIAVLVARVDVLFVDLTAVDTWLAKIEERHGLVTAQVVRHELARVMDRFSGASRRST